MSKKKLVFEPTTPRPDFVEIEKNLLKWWYENGVVEKYLKRNDRSARRFSFMDGPITANNPMGVHHAWGRTLKDFYQRFHNMLGFAQRFQNGFDNQGLWVEVEVEKELGFKTKKEIEDFGIDKFVEKCKKRTLKFAEVQTEQSKRLGYFMDWDNSYLTMSDENNYMIWSFLKKCHSDGNLYKGRDSVPWCPRCGTAISQHEILTEEYQELTHDSIFFELPVEGKQDERFLVWTTTPWTLPANVALAVHPELDYAQVMGDTGLKFWLASSLVNKIFGPKAKTIKKIKGEKLKGLKYTAPFDGLPAVQAAKKENPDTFHTVVLSEEYVNEEEGTGIVHIATGCGGEDFQLGKEENLPVIAAIDEAANYLDGFGDLSGKSAKDHPDLILSHDLLKIKVGQPPQDYIFEIKPYTHRYPVCWRCKTELVWRVVNEWYIAMDGTNHSGAKSYRRRMMKVIKGIKWIPSFGYDRELDWLRNMHDWLISKKRYWGLAIPIWECECGHFEVIGSKEELKKRAVSGWQDFEGHTPHRPWIDKVMIKCQKCGRKVSRIPDVGNPWLDAGIVTYSTLKYRTDKKYWQQWFPADLILECFPGQFKNWFYSLIAMSTVLEDKPPTKVVYGHALVRDEKGEEMHKSKGNSIEFNQAAEKMGVDVMRWHYCTQNPRLNLNFGFSIADEVRRRFHLLLWNVYHYFVTYANLDNWQPKASLAGRPKPLDLWILTRLNQLIIEVTRDLKVYRTHRATEKIENFVQDLSTWWLRRSRERMGPTADDRKDKELAYSVLYTVLLTMAKVLAPFTPFLSEAIFQNLVNQGTQKTNLRSVHLEDWPGVSSEEVMDLKLLEQMKLVRKICESGHAARKKAGIKVRQPLLNLTIYNLQFSLKEELTQLIKDELNVKKVKFVTSKTQKRLGLEAEFSVKFDTKLTPDLKVEGQVRDLIREIQSLRKDKGCRLDEKIRVVAPGLPVDPRLLAYIKQKTLALELTPGKKIKITTSK